MREESTGESERRRPRIWRLIVAAVMLVLAVVVLGAAVRFSGRSHAATVYHDTQPTDLATAAADTDAPTVSAVPVTAPSSVATSPTSPPPLALSKPSAGPALTTTAATKAASKTAIKAPTTAPTKAFTPITVQAEASTSALSGGAAEVACGTCRAGARVRYLGRVDIHATVPVSGTRTITIVYEADGIRGFDVSINGGPPVTTLWVTGTDWTTPKSIAVTTSIPVGSVDIGLYGEAGNPPDLDAVTIS